MSKNNGDFSPWAVGCAAATRILTASAQAALCVAAGLWIDRRLETSPCGTLVGAVFGGVAFVVGLVATTKRLAADSDAGGVEGERSVRKLDRAEFNAAISAESLKTEALREALEATDERAAAFFAKKTENSPDPIAGSVPERRR